MRVKADHHAAKHELKEKLGHPRDLAPPEVADGGIVGYALGPKLAGGRPTGELAIHVFVRAKGPRSKVARRFRVPGQVAGIPTDVIAVGTIRARDVYTTRERPAHMGSSCGHKDITAGTAGSLVVLKNRRLCLLSNNHVLGNSDDGQPGDVILQPGVVDGGRLPADDSGNLETFAPLLFPGPNTADCAVAWCNFQAYQPAHHTYTLDPTPAEPRLGMAVVKEGRTTGRTTGQIQSIAADLNVDYEQGRIATFHGQVRIVASGAPFSQPGDSGSLIVTADGYQPTALLFSGGMDPDGIDSTFACPIRAVMTALQIDRFVTPADVVVTSPPAPPTPPAPAGPAPTPDLLAAVNAARAAASASLPPLKADARLTAAALDHCAFEQRTHRFGHQGIGDGTPWDRLGQVGYVYRAAAENLAYGYQDVAAVVAAWLASPAHRANLLGPYLDAGMARAGDYWCLDLGTPA
jgi:uncharacterized protein YkwD